MSSTVTPGDRAFREFVVEAGDTAIELGSGDVPVLATPRVIAWLEAAAVAALTLPEGKTSVGVHIAVDHLAASPVGAPVVAEANVQRIDGTRIGFDVSLRDGDRVVAAGTHTRVVVDRRKFLDRL